MKKLIIALIIGFGGVWIWNVARRSVSQGDAAERLRGAIDASGLPPGAKADMRQLLDQRRTRPSQYGVDPA